MKKDLFVSILIGLMLMLVSGAVVISAAEGDEVDETDAKCAVVVLEEGRALLDDYKEFLYEYFNKNVPSSDQVEQAMKFYRYVEDRMNEIYADEMGISASRTFEEYADENATCLSNRNEIINEANLLLQGYLRNAVATKQTTAMVDAMNDLNNNMEEFSSDFHTTFPALFNEMSNGLPCYAQACISK